MSIPEWARSAALTFGVAFIGLILAPDFAWSKAAALAATLAAARTAFSAVVAGGSFGYRPIGSHQLEPLELEAPSRFRDGAT